MNAAPTWEGGSSLDQWLDFQLWEWELQEDD